MLLSLFTRALSRWTRPTPFGMRRRHRSGPTAPALPSDMPPPVWGRGAQAQRTPRVCRGCRGLLLLGLIFPGFALPASGVQLPGCRPTQVIGMIPLDDLLVPIARVDPACGDPDTAVPPRDDGDGDRLSDSWERTWFGNLTTASGAPGALTAVYPDGLTDLEKWRFGLNPTVDHFGTGTVNTALTYDLRGQLVAVTFQGAQVSLTYDTAGNLRTVAPPAP